MGTVVEVGPKVTKNFKKGDRVAGFTHGVNAVEKEDGCFAQYAVAKGDVQCKLPDNLSDEDAATLGVGVTTVGQGLYQSLGLPLPGSGEKTDEPLLVYGGSTATGSLAIQFAVLSGCKVVTTCSPRNFPFVKALGAAEAFDYNDPDCAKKIREYTGDKLTKVFDCISEGDSPKISSEAISSKGGAVSYLLNPKHDRTDVENKVSSPLLDQESLDRLTYCAGYSRLHRHWRSLQVLRRYGVPGEAAGLRVWQDFLGACDQASRQPAAHCSPYQGWLGGSSGCAQGSG